MSLQDALQALSAAHGPKALIRAFGALRGEVARARRGAQKQFGTLAQTFAAAMQIWDQQKAEGVPEAERQAGLEKTLRVAWPQVREWKYLCDRCGDTGYEYRHCPEIHCGRPFKLPGQKPDDYAGRACRVPHGYVVPCACEKGQAIRRVLMKTPPPVNLDADYKQAGLTKVGRSK